MVIILRANKVNLVVSSVLFVFWYHSSNVLDTPHICNISWLRVKLSRYQLKMVVAILTGHAPVRKHLRTMGLFEGDPTCRFCMKEAETMQHIICCWEALACQRYNVFGILDVEPTDIRIASVRDLCLFIRGTGLRNIG
jgi:hypothetical protein